MTRAIEAQPETRTYFGSAQSEVTAAGTTGTIDVTAFIGDASWGGYQMVSGTWFHHPGEAVVPTPFLTATGTKVGDTVVLTDHGKAVPVKITGEVFVTSNQGMNLLTDANDKVHGQVETDRWCGGIVDDVGEHADALRRHFLERLTYRGERRGGRHGCVDVVETDEEMSSGTRSPRSTQLR
jgi:hypothetical protein